MPTPRLLVLLLLAAPFGAASGPLVLIAAAMFGLVVLAAAVDWFLAADGRRIRARRILLSDKLSLADWNPIEIRVENGSARAQRVIVRDVTPSGVELNLPVAIFRAALAIQSGSTFTYQVRPSRRGDASFGDLYIRTEGPLGLVQRTYCQADSSQAVRIYPNLRELRRYDLLARRGLDAQPVGRPIRRAGVSTEFERVRDYVPDDEFRHINWKATARRAQLMVNQFQAERSQNLVVLLDAGRSMSALAGPPRTTDTLDGAADAGLTKLDFALNAALLLAYMASARGDHVALLAYTDDVRAFVPPQRGRRALLNSLGAVYNLRAEPVEPDHGRAFEFLDQRNLRRSLVVLFTDLSDRESSTTLSRHVLRAARQHLVVCVTLADPNVRRPAERRPRNVRELYEKMVAQQLLDDRVAVLARLAAHGVMTVDADADTLHPRLISTYLELKARGRV